MPGNSNPPATPGRLHGRVALVTGASQGIGLGIALRLAREGAAVALNARRDDERAHQARQQVADAGGRCELFVTDVNETQALRPMVQAVEARLGGLDILVNNAGIERHDALLDVKEADFDAVLATNLRAPFFLSQAFAQHLRQAGRGGRIVHISSVHEDLPFPNFAPYCASKGGLRMLMRTMAIELAPLGITVNNVAPGAIRTPINTTLLQNAAKLAALKAQIPAGRLGEPQDVAGVVTFLCSEDAAYVTGATVVVDGGLLWNYSEQ